MSSLSTNFFDTVKRKLSRIESIPGIRKESQGELLIVSDSQKQGYLKSQTLAQNCALEISKIIQPGWSEIQTVQTMDTWLRDHGVKSYFHRPFAWFSDRTRFDGIKNYSDYQATRRRLLEGDIFILDVAPIVEGFISDIGFSGVIGANENFFAGKKFLERLRHEIPIVVSSGVTGGELWRWVHQEMVQAGYENIHQKYPFSVLGHRVYQTKERGDLGILNFGWQSFWEISSRGIFGQLLNQDYEGSMEGLWAIEPQIGGKDWGMKFEEILEVRGGKAFWLNPESRWSLAR